MSTVTIPKVITRGNDLMVVPRKDYEEFLGWRKKMKTTEIFEPPQKFKTYKPTTAERREIAEARKNFAEGRYLAWDQFKYELESFYRRKSAKRSQAPSSKGRDAH